MCIFFYYPEQMINHCPKKYVYNFCQFVSVFSPVVAEHTGKPRAFIIWAQPSLSDYLKTAFQKNSFSVNFNNNEGS